MKGVFAKNILCETIRIRVSIIIKLFKFIHNICLDLAFPRYCFTSRLYLFIAQ